MRLKTRTRDIFDNVMFLMVIVATILLGFMWLSVVAEVVLRYFLKISLTWMIEVAEYILLWICFLGTAWVLGRDRHVRMDVVLARLSPKNAALLSTFTSIIGALLCLLVTWYSGKVVWEFFQAKVLETSILEPPRALILVIIPIGTFLLSIQFLRLSRKYLNIRRTAAKEERSLLESLELTM